MFLKHFSIEMHEYTIFFVNQTYCLVNFSCYWIWNIMIFFERWKFSREKKIRNYLSKKQINIINPQFLTNPRTTHWKTSNQRVKAIIRIYVRVTINARWNGIRVCRYEKNERTKSDVKTAPFRLRRLLGLWLFVFGLLER